MSTTNRTYVVAAGDTLTAIIKKFYGGFSEDILKSVSAASKISDPSKLKVGQLVTMPGRWTDPPAVVEVAHTNAEITQLVTKTEPGTGPRSGEPAHIDVNLPKGDYWQEVVKKTLVVLHFTAGYTADSAIATFKQPGRVATAYVVGRDGKIYQLFDPKYWSYHLGQKDYNNNWNNDRRSIGIEIVNIGPVWLKNGKWYDYVHKEWPADQIDIKPNKDAGGTVKFTPQQVAATFNLVDWLMTANTGISRKVWPGDKTQYALPAVNSFNGITTHQQFRRDKYDLGPGWPWARMVTDLRLQ